MTCRPFDISALARAINARRIACARERGETVPITSAMSRILENDREYVPYRSRIARKRGGPARNPRIATLVEIAAALDTTVGALLGETPYRMGVWERRELRRIVLTLTRLFELDAPEVRSSAATRGIAHGRTAE
ncbi:MAG: hypothetical protein AABO58_00940 [Acidobacteriota bacterium]